MKKKWLALLLSCTMVLNTCAVPVAASAVDSVSSVVSEVEEQEAEPAQEAEPSVAEETTEDTQPAEQNVADAPAEDDQIDVQAADTETKGKIEVETNFADIAEAGDTFPVDVYNASYYALPSEIDYTATYNVGFGGDNTFSYSGIITDLEKKYQKKYKLKKVTLKIGETTVAHAIADYDTFVVANDKKDAIDSWKNADEFEVGMIPDQNYIGEGVVSLQGTLKKPATISLEFEKVQQAVTKGTISVSSNFADIAEAGDALPKGYDDHSSKVYWGGVADEIDFTQTKNLEWAWFSYGYVVRDLNAIASNTSKYKLKSVSLTIGDKTLKHEIGEYKDQINEKNDPYTEEGLFKYFGSENFEIGEDEGSCFGDGAVSLDGTLKANASIYMEFEKVVVAETATLENITVSSRKATSATLTATASAAGKLWYLTKATAEAAPTADEIKAQGTGVDVAEAGAVTLNLTDLTKAATTVYMVLEGKTVTSEVYSQDLEKVSTLLGKFQDSNGTVEFDSNNEGTTYWDTGDIQYRLKLFTESGATSDSGVNLTFYYTDTTGKEVSTDAAFKNTYVWFKTGFIDYNGKGNDLHIRATKGDVTEEYTVHVLRKAPIASFTLQDTKNNTISISPTFSKTKTEYTVSVLNNVNKVVLKAEDAVKAYFPEESAVLFNGERSEDGTYEMDLQPGENKVTFKADNGAAEATEYTLTITQVESATLNFKVTPENAQVCLYDAAGVRIYPENGTYYVFPDKEYTYSAACEGYVGQKDTVTVTAEEKSATKEITLEKAAESAELPKPEPEYPGFRADKNNQSVIDAKTPITKESIEVKWERQMGTGVNPTSGSTPVIVGGKIYTQSAGKLYMLDKETGEILKSSDCFMNAGFNLIPVTYGDGMIFVPLGGGVQCFNATTLESLWTYKAPSGACNSPIRYDNGRIYVGFQVAKKDAFVCLTTTDEDPSNQTELKVPLWTNYGDTGYWWAGAWTNDKNVFAVNQDGYLMVMDKETGETVQKIATKSEKNKGARSDVAYYNGRIYFSTQSGYVYSYNLTEDGLVDTEHMIEPLYFGGASTCTPAIYNDRMYIGISGGSAFGEDGASIMVADINPDTGAMSMAYLVPTPTDFGYCQTSGLIVKGYEEEDGFVYVYFLCNNAKGALYMVKDKPGITSPEPESGLFYTPTHEQYCIASAVADSDGTIYIKNDSAWQFAIKRSESYLSGIELTGGNAVLDGGADFAGSVKEHTITVDKDATEVTLNLTANEGTEVRMNGVVGSKQTISLTGDKTVVEVALIKGESTRTYTFSIFRGPTLTAMNITDSPNLGMGNTFSLDPSFDPMQTEYSAGANVSSPRDGYIWFSQLNTTDTLTCTVVSGVSGKEAGDTIQIRTNYKGDKYIDVPFADRSSLAKNTAVVDLTLTSADGSQSRTYRVTLYTNGAVPLLTLGADAVTERTNDSATIKVTANTAGTILYLAQDAAAEAPDADKIQSEGKSVEAVAGENTLTLTELTKKGYKVYMLLKQEDGKVSTVKSVELEKLFVLGDIDDNGTVELTDAVQLLDKVTAGEDVSTDVGDLNGDGVVDLNDAVQLLDKVTAQQ